MIIDKTPGRNASGHILRIAIGKCFVISLLAILLLAGLVNAQSDYFDNFSSYPTGHPPSGWLLRGATEVSPKIEEIGGTGPDYQLVNFPEVSWQYWDKWLLKDGLTPSSDYTVTVKLNFQNNIADRAGLTIAWNDSDWTRIDIQPNVYGDGIEFRPMTSPNLVVTNYNSIVINGYTDYWLRVVVIDNGPNQGMADVYWSTDNINYIHVLTATGLSRVTGLVGMSTAGPHLPHTHFDDFSVISNTPPPTITVTSPNSGENWQAGTTQAIQWSYTGNPGPNVKIDLLKDGIVDQTIVDNMPIGSSGNGVYDWAIPSTITAGNYQIRISSTTNDAYKDTSDQNFVISPPTPPPTPPKPSNEIGEIYGSVYSDFNNNGKRDPDGEKGEPGLADWTVTLLSVSDGDIYSDTAVTNGNGEYVFNNLPVGTYTIQETEKNRWESTSPKNPEWYTVEIKGNKKTIIRDQNFGNRIIAGQAPTRNTFYAGINWKSGAEDVDQQAWTLDALLVHSYEDTGATVLGFPSYNGALGLYDVYMAYNGIPTEKNYLNNAEGNCGWSYPCYGIAFSHSGGTQTLLKKLQSGATKADYAVFIAPALISQEDVENLVDPANPKVKKVIIVQSEDDALYNFKAEFKNNPPLITLIKIPRGNLKEIAGLVAVIVAHPVDKFLSETGIDSSLLPADEIFWAGGADAHANKKAIPFQNTANVVVVNMDKNLQSLKDNRWDVHHQLLVETIRMFQNKEYPFDGIYEGLEKVGDDWGGS